MKLITTQQSLNVSGGQEDSFDLFLDIIKIIFNVTDTNSTNYNYGYHHNATHYNHTGYGHYNYTQNHNFTHYNASY